MALLAAAPSLGEFMEPAEGIDVDYLVCGLAASLGAWKPFQFHRFLAWCGAAGDGEPLPDLLADHERWLWASRGRADASLGRCLQFAAVPPAGACPGGLLVLAALHPARAQQVVASMRGGKWGAMSVGGVEHGDPGSADLWPAEVSLVRAGDQADPGALVIGTGREAVAAWELLTGSPPAIMSVRAPRPGRASPPSARCPGSAVASAIYRLPHGRGGGLRWRPP